jgi:hypothetical protein
LPSNTFTLTSYQEKLAKMGGGHLNMKKCWDSLLLKNQEQILLEERKAVGAHIYLWNLC